MPSATRTFSRSSANTRIVSLSSRGSGDDPPRHDHKSKTFPDVRKRLSQSAAWVLAAARPICMTGGKGHRTFSAFPHLKCGVVELDKLRPERVFIRHQWLRSSM